MLGLLIDKGEINFLGINGTMGDITAELLLVIRVIKEELEKKSKDDAKLFEKFITNHIDIAFKNREEVDELFKKAISQKLNDEFGSKNKAILDAVEKAEKAESLEDITDVLEELLGELKES